MKIWRQKMHLTPPPPPPPPHHSCLGLVRSWTVVLLLSIHCCMHLRLFVGFCVWSLLQPLFKKKGKWISYQVGPSSVCPPVTFLLIVFSPKPLDVSASNFTIASFLRCTGYLNFINGHISRALLLILVHVQLLSCLFF